MSLSGRPHEMTAITFLPAFNATTMPMSSTKWPPSEEDWARQERRIRRLYLDQNKPLKEVMTIMEREYGFKATVNMYKAHITKWKLDKKNKEHEVLAVVRKKTERDAVGKPSSFYLRGRPVSLDDLPRYLKRKGMSIEDAIRLRAASPPELRCFTPESVPGSPAKLEVFDGPQQIFVSIRNYVLGCVEAKTWFLLDADGFCVSVKGMDQNIISSFISSISTACNFLQQGSFQKAGLFLLKALAVTRDLILQEHPHLLLELLNCMISLREKESIDCANIILHQFLDMAIIVLPEMHPLRIILRNLISVNPELTKDALTRAWGSFAEIFEEAVGASSSSSIQIRTRYIQKIIRVQDPPVAEGQLRSMVEKLKEVHTSPDIRYMTALSELADLLLAQQRYTDAAATAEELIHYTNKSGFPYAVEYQRQGMEVLADIQYCLFDDESAESSLRQLTDMYAISCGWQHGRTLWLLAKLERWLKEFGKHEEAAVLSEQIEEILRQSNFLV